MKKNILIIQGHPDPESFNAALFDAYKKGALEAGAQVSEIHISELKFDPNLAFGYNKRVELEPCLLESQEKIINADHIVLIHPVWWGSLPAMLKGFFDRVFLPTFAFKKREGSLFWDKHLSGKSARIIATMDQPAWYYWLVYWAPSHRALKKLTFEFCGIKPVRITSIGPVRNSKESFRENWLRRVEILGRKIR